ncbi:hypothetical protein ACJX0J_038605, partial [Zea mays]
SGMNVKNHDTISAIQVQHAADKIHINFLCNDFENMDSKEISLINFFLRWQQSNDRMSNGPTIM